MNNHDTSDDLDWQADRFLLEELSPAEQAEFAHLLADDQAARETLAAETLLLGTLAQLEAADYAPRELVTPAGNHAQGQSFHWTSFHWTGIASSLLAASLLLAAVLLNQPATTDMSAGSNDLADNGQYEEVKQLVSLWSETSESAESLSPWDTMADGHDPEVVEESLAPDWMVAAVEAESSQGSAPVTEDMQWQ